MVIHQFLNILFQFIKFLMRRNLTKSIQLVEFLCQLLLLLNLLPKVVLPKIFFKLLALFLKTTQTSLDLLKLRYLFDNWFDIFFIGFSGAIGFCALLFYLDVICYTFLSLFLAPFEDSKSKMCVVI